ncbi:capsule biosynthesis protein [Salibaculum halophilum]|uniref:capsule biosynthesis protein n=1 Tax=Salibaculum halophilum TaxID=1914408 RepID=UPI000A10D878|nr:capsule biosynthesis protein [Salibaculum halophilum]
MTTKPKARKYRIRRNASLASQAQPEAAADPQPDAGRVVRSDSAPAAAANANVTSPEGVATEADLDAIRKEGLTGRQLRMARRVAHKHGLAVTSDFDAVRQLRKRGIDPFQRNNVLELVTPGDKQTDKASKDMANTARPASGGAQAQGAGQEQDRVQLPQTVVHKTNVASPDQSARPEMDQRASEIRAMQRDIAKRRRRKLLALFARLTAFVFLPTFAMGWYFFVIATPMYATKSEFVIQQAEAQGSSGFGGLFQGTGLATQSEAVNAQAFLTSREAMLRLNEDHGFKAHFQTPEIDAIQRLEPDATNEDAYDLYQDHVQVGYDPTEGVVNMEVIAADPEKSQEFAQALIRYTEDRVDALTQRMREDQMADAIANYEAAEADRQEALSTLTRVQREAEVVDPASAVSALQQRISALEMRLDEKRIELASLQSNTRPNEARVSAVQGEIDRISDQIDDLRGQLSEGRNGGPSQAEVVAKLREAEENYAFAIERVTAAQAAMDQARIEANRQVRFLSVSVAPVAPDEPTYPRAFENTLLSLLIFSGIYLMISLTASILREQVSS